ncbi:MAG: aromatic ring-hydroxylating dioxygenase subunit alpha [Rhodospirillaceae bacterium]|nr:MAG: aromatic ring-hydroxylating dioxygenase subunit alpha [Rhodospirillaceae bacterium]
MTATQAVTTNITTPANLQNQGNGLPRALPAWTYRNAELIELEYERLILPSWQFVCHINQVKNPGDFATLDLMRDSIIVMRGKDKSLRAFMNVCRHRGAKLLDGSGTCKHRLVCPYHAWSYNFDGSLAGVPAEDTFPGLDKQEFGLKPVELEVVLGMVFIRVIPGGPSLKEMWGDYVDLVAEYRLEEMVPVDEPWTDVWQCNWKVGVDNNLENYHIPLGHPGYHRMLDNDLQGFINVHGVAGSKSVLKDKPSPNWVERFYQQMAPEVLLDLPEETRRTWYFFTLPPNIGIDIYPDSMDVFQILPRGAETCVVRYPVYRRPDENREQKVLRYLNGRINRQVGAEDRELCERVQLGIGSRGYEAGPLSSYEIALKDFHDRIRAVCPIATSPKAPAAGTLRQRDAELSAAAKRNGN